MGQDGSQKLPKSAKIAKRCVFENMCLLLFFATDLEHRTSEENPKSARKPRETTPQSLQEVVQKKVYFWSLICPKSNAEMLPKMLEKQSPQEAKQHTEN